MNAATTEGKVTALTAHTTGYGNSKHVVGSMITITTATLDGDDNAVEVNSQLFLAPNSQLPELGAEVVIILGEQGILELSFKSEVIGLEATSVNG